MTMYVCICIEERGDGGDGHLLGVRDGWLRWLTKGFEAG